MKKTIIEEHIVGDCELITALDSFYRKRMKKYEVKVLLPLADDIFSQLNISPNEFPAEGYYCETNELKRYFNNIMTLKEVPIKLKDKISNDIGYKKIIELFCSGLYGDYEFDGYILPKIYDPLYKAMDNLPVEKWNSKNILDKAYSIISKSNVYSIINLGIFLKNPVLVTLLRESVALYPNIYITGTDDESIKIVNKYVWNVTKDIEDLANRIIEKFNNICLYKIPNAIKKNARIYFNEYNDYAVDLRCVRLGYDYLKKLHYHWAICSAGETYKEYKYLDFWDNKHWTTKDLKYDYSIVNRKIKWDNIGIAKRHITNGKCTPA